MGYYDDESSYFREYDREDRQRELDMQREDDDRYWREANESHDSWWDSDSSSGGGYSSYGGSRSGSSYGGSSEPYYMGPIGISILTFLGYMACETSIWYLMILGSLIGWFGVFASRKESKGILRNIISILVFYFAKLLCLILGFAGFWMCIIYQFMGK